MAEAHARDRVAVCAGPMIPDISVPVTLVVLGAGFLHALWNALLKSAAGELQSLGSRAQSSSKAAASLVRDLRELPSKAALQLRSDAVLLFEHRSLEGRQHARHIPNRDKFENLWREVLKEGVRTKQFVCDDIPLTARAILGILNWTITWYRPNGSMTVEQIADHYSKLLLNGLMK